METMTPASVIRLMPESKEQIAVFVNSAVDQILSGQVNSLEAALYLKAMEDVVKGIRENKDVKESIRFDLLESDGKATIGNATIAIVDRSVYDYSVDLHWSDLDKQIKKLSELRKSREQLLQKLEKEVADPDTGEMITPATKTVSQTIRVTIK